MFKYTYLITAFIVSLFIMSCEDPLNPTNEGAGSLYIQSQPAGAQIWVDGDDKGRLTPDSVTAIQAGNRQVTLKLAGYRDTTFTVEVFEGKQSSKFVTLQEDRQFIMYTDTLWETVGTTALQPSGLDLSEGVAVSISNNNNYDIYYSSNGFVIRSSESRISSFYLSSSQNIDDGTDSPVAQPAGQGGWRISVPDDTEFYFFIYDSDGHYSKMKITKSGGGNIIEDAWVIVQWYYNTRADDKKF